jgi:hypothetical protein
MMREKVIIKSFLIDKPKQTKIFEVRIPRELERIIGIELGFSLVEGILPEPTSDGTVGTHGLFSIGIARNVCVGELRLQNVSKANLFYAGELKIDRNIDKGDFSSQFFPPKIYTHQIHSFETEVKLTAKNRVIRGIYRDKLSDHISEAFKYKVSVYIWTELKEEKETEEKK